MAEDQSATFGRMKMKRVLINAVVGALSLAVSGSHAANVVEE